MNKLLCNISTEIYDKDHDASPMLVKDRYGERLGRLRKSHQAEEVLEVIDNTYEVGRRQGVKDAKADMRKVLGL